jgi:hypothetical protein
MDGACGEHGRYEKCKILFEKLVAKWFVLRAGRILIIFIFRKQGRGCAFKSSE